MFVFLDRIRFRNPVDRTSIQRHVRPMFHRSGGGDEVESHRQVVVFDRDHLEFHSATMGGERRTVGLRLRFVAVNVDQFRGCPRRDCNIRPVLRRIAGFEWRSNHTGGDELVEAAPRVSALCTRRNKFGDYAATNGDRDTFAGLDTPDVPSQVVLEFADVRGSSVNYGHFGPHRRATTLLTALRGERPAPDPFLTTRLTANSSRLPPGIKPSMAKRMNGSGENEQIVPESRH